jgi:NAD(P)-dependent dehydrogenase (short-subunit alcohol dehydrogenase family)
MSKLDLDGRVIAITGGARGIGLEVARAAAQRGATPALLDIDGEAAVAAARDLGGDAVGLAADVTDLPELERAFVAVVDRLGGVDVLVANAGIGPRSTTVDAGDRAHQRRILDVNLHGVWHTMWAGVPHVVQRRGHVVAVSSIAAFLPTPAWAAYGASKAAVESLARSMRMELAPTGVTVGVAHFGLIDTALVDGFAADALTARVEALAPALFRHRAAAPAAGQALVDGIAGRKARTVFPGPYFALYLLRGILGPLGDAILMRDPRLRALTRELRVRDAAEADARDEVAA